ncbi:MAG: hypothetical protein V9F04_15260 [Dermatophilaceae bacterium]
MATNDWLVEVREYASTGPRRGRRHAYEHLGQHWTALVRSIWWPKTCATFFGGEVTEAYARFGGRALWRGRLASGLDVQPNDLAVEKTAGAGGLRR